MPTPSQLERCHIIYWFVALSPTGYTQKATYDIIRIMSDKDEKILKALENLQTYVTALQADVTTIKNVQQKQGAQLVTLQADVKSLHGKVDTVEFKVEAIHAYQAQ
jgi:peptidoglycan hydrolase CwlO-like protein